MVHATTLCGTWKRVAVVGRVDGVLLHTHAPVRDQEHEPVDVGVVPGTIVWVTVHFVQDVIHEAEVGLAE